MPKKITPLEAALSAHENGFSLEEPYSAYGTPMQGVWIACGHEDAVSLRRLRDGIICQECKGNKNAPTRLYLIERKSETGKREQKLGYTTELTRRVKEHARKGWALVDATPPMARRLAVDTETKCRQWLRDRGLTTKQARVYEVWNCSSYRAESIFEIAALAEAPVTAPSTAGVAA